MQELEPRVFHADKLMSQFVGWMLTMWTLMSSDCNWRELGAKRNGQSSLDWCI